MKTIIKHLKTIFFMLICLSIYFVNDYFPDGILYIGGILLLIVIYFFTYKIVNDESDFNDELDF